MTAWKSARELFHQVTGWGSPPTSRNRSRRVEQPESIEVVRCENLEDRVLLSALTILIDYSHDTNHFFDTQEKRDLFQEAANTYASRIVDNLTAITPSGENTWEAEFTDPATGETVQVGNLSVPADTLIIYAGGRDLDDSTLGIGGPGGYSANGSGSWLATVDHRGQAGATGNHPTDFGPWGGSITFDTTGTDWYFGTSAAGLGSQQADFLSVATHELGHILGFGTSESFDNYVKGDKFTGPKAAAEYDYAGYPRVNDDASHWAEGTTDNGHEVSMDPSISLGSRKLLTDLDWAALDDIGWTLTSTSSLPTPTLSFLGAIPVFVRGGARTTFDSTATISNPGELGLKGAQLQATILQNLGKYDVVTIGVGNGITKSGATLKYNGVSIGTYSNGRDGRRFKLTFNGKATDEAVQACLQNLEFYTTSRKAGTLDRTLSVRVVNMSGQNSAPDTLKLRIQ